MAVGRLFLVFNANYFASSPSPVPKLPLLSGPPRCAFGSPPGLVYLHILLHQVLAHYVVLFPGALGRDTRDRGFPYQSQRRVWGPGGEMQPWKSMVAHECPGAVTYSSHCIKTTHLFCLESQSLPPAFPFILGAGPKWCSPSRCPHPRGSQGLVLRTSLSTGPLPLVLEWPTMPPTMSQRSACVLSSGGSHTLTPRIHQSGSEPMS